ERRAIEKCHRELFDALEQCEPQIGKAVLCDHHGQVKLSVESRELAENQDQVQRSHHEQSVIRRDSGDYWRKPLWRSDLAMREKNIDGEFDDVWLGQREGRVER